MAVIRINFIPLIDQDREITIYRKKVADPSVEKEVGVYRTKLPIQPDDEEWGMFDILGSEREGFEEYSFCYKLNAALAEYCLFQRTKACLQKYSGYFNYRLPANSKYKEIIFTLKELRHGNTELVVHPFFLRSEQLIGFLFQIKFSLHEGCSFDRNVQIESLSLDKSGKPNVFMFRDKERLMEQFIGENFAEFCQNSNMAIHREFQQVPVSELARKSYQVGNGQVSKSQFIGIKNAGPYRALNEHVNYLFVFSERTRTLGRDLYSGLVGKLFPGQFLGLSRMFGLAINKERVGHIVLRDFQKTDLDEFEQQLVEYQNTHGGQKVIVVVVLPKGFKGNDKAFDAYGYTKLIALKHDVICQFVTEDTFYKKDLLKWSVSNIGLQMFSKLGGAPWLVKPAKNNCLIMGLGSSHEIIDGQVKKWFAYTVCLDSSGDFKYIKPLSSAKEQANYIEDFKVNLKEIVTSELDNQYRSFVLHLPFKMKYSEIEAIKEVVDSFSQDSCELIVIRINTHHKYMGFSSHNTRVPYESSYIQLSKREFLLWPEGLQHGKEVLRNRVSDPLYIDFIEAPNDWENKKNCLQDILNLTGANWRGFNAKAQPISILYSKLIADFMKEFSHLEGVEDFSMLEVESVAPWFL